MKQKSYSSLLENTKGREVVNLNPVKSGIDRKIRSELLETAKLKYGYAEAFGDKIPAYIQGAYTDDTFAGEESPNKLIAADDIDAEGRLMLYHATQSGGMDMISLMTAFNPERLKDFVKTSAADGTHTYIEDTEFLPTLSKEEIAHWWYMSERAIKVYVKKLIKVADRDDAAAVAAHYSDKST